MEHTIITKRKPGRPKLANSLSNTERQRRWRLRQKERNAQMYSLLVRLLSERNIKA
jgi:hypothetical protein